MATKATQKSPAKKEPPHSKGPAKKEPPSKAPARKEPPGKAPPMKVKAGAKKAQAPAKAKAPAKSKPAANSKPKPAAKSKVPAKAATNGKTVDGYVAKLDSPLAGIISSLRGLIREAAPDATETLKWAQPIYEANGPFAFIKAFRTHVNFGFWRGAGLPDPDGVLAGGGDRMRHVKLSSPDDIRKVPFQALVRHAIRLNQELGDPTKRS